jgi:hypothetical protein
VTPEEKVAIKLMDPTLVLIPPRGISDVFDCPFREGHCTVAYDRSWTVKDDGNDGDRLIKDKRGMVIGAWLMCPDPDDIKTGVKSILLPKRCPLRVGSLEVRMA